MPRRKFYCGVCDNRLPDLPNDVCRLLSYKNLNSRRNKFRPLDYDEWEWNEKTTKEIERYQRQKFISECREKVGDIYIAGCEKYR